MAIDNKLEKLVDEVTKNAAVSGQQIALHFALNLIPFAGSPITALLSGIAQRRIVERLCELFQTIKEEISKIDEKSVNKEYFTSEEFQTLFALAMEQLETTHQKRKLKLLGVALAHSGLKEFDAETRKELFIRSLRDLSAAHIQMLSELLPNFELHASLDRETVLRYQRPARDWYSGEALTMIQHLFALGFVEQQPKPKALNQLTPRLATSWTETDWLNQFTEFLSQPHRFEYRITELGHDFLKFLGITQLPDKFQFHPGPPFKPTD